MFIRGYSLRNIFPTKMLICSRLFAQPPRGFGAKKSGGVPDPEGHRFFLYKAFKLDKNPRHLRHRCSNPGKPFIRIFGRSGILFIPLFPGEQVNKGREENYSFLRTSLRSFRRRCLSGEFLTEEELSSCPGLRDSHL